MRGIQKDGLQIPDDSTQIPLMFTDTRGKHHVLWFLTQPSVCKRKTLITKGDQMPGVLDREFIVDL